MQITPEGTIAIPAHLLHQAGFLPQAEVELRAEKGQIVIISAEEKAKRIAELRRISAENPLTSGLNADDIMQLTRG